MGSFTSPAAVKRTLRLSRVWIKAKLQLIVLKEFGIADVAPDDRHRAVAGLFMMDRSLSPAVALAIGWCSRPREACFDGHTEHAATDRVGHVPKRRRSATPGRRRSSPTRH
jgi:hypothetical protein